ncbi:PhnP protein, partial [Escherichia coli]|nr:PhnP protein [Escherichia coli]
MKLKYFGSAAAEGVRALFCKSSVCLEAKKRGGRDIRTRMQSLVNDELLIGFNGDTHSHYIKYDFDFADIEHLLVTHGHADHFYA